VFRAVDPVRRVAESKASVRLLVAGVFLVLALGIGGDKPPGSSGLAAMALVLGLSMSQRIGPAFVVLGRPPLGLLLLAVGLAVFFIGFELGWDGVAYVVLGLVLAIRVDDILRRYML
jgi:hypothetical protein